MTCKGFFPPLVLEGKIERNTSTYAQCVFNLFLISASVKPEMLIYCPPLPYTELIGGSAHKR